MSGRAGVVQAALESGVDSGPTRSSARVRSQRSWRAIQASAFSRSMVLVAVAMWSSDFLVADPPLVLWCTNTGVLTLRVNTLSVDAVKKSDERHTLSLIGKDDARGEHTREHRRQPQHRTPRQGRRGRMLLADRRPRPAGRHHRRHHPLLPARTAAPPGRALGAHQPLRPRAPRAARAHQGPPAAALLARRDPGAARRATARASSKGCSPAAADARTPSTSSSSAPASMPGLADALRASGLLRDPGEYGRDAVRRRRPRPPAHHGRAPRPRHARRRHRRARPHLRERASKRRSARSSTCSPPAAGFHGIPTHCCASRISPPTRRPRSSRSRGDSSTTRTTARSNASRSTRSSAGRSPPTIEPTTD